MSDERLGARVVVGNVTITPVERVAVRAERLGDGVVAHGDKRVVAILVRRGDEEWRLELPDPDRAFRSVGSAG